ncbi:MAG: thiol:disulfide interchange protein DsbC [Methylococcaceae bacterium NSP1-2]|nr:DsbC family protein [Methylococcaceae bacterium]OYV17666.1 MAG: thiol:disulfide interchange protein DsbC [Methylococcaceae bacterium NSP1-2]
MKKIITLAAVSLLSLAFSTAYADENTIKQSIAKSMPTMKIDAIKPSEVKGLYEVLVGTNVFYVSDDGKYLIEGHLIDIAARKDLTEGKLSESHVKAINKLGTDKMIIFKPKTSKYTVTIFTDIDCGYCRKLHSEIDSYLAEGITIQYVFFPRTGKDTESYKKAVSVWCADDRKAALTAAKKGEAVKAKTCANPVDEHMKLAGEFEVNGTPTIVSEKGTVYPGYLPAKQLVEMLKGENAPK